MRGFRGESSMKWLFLFTVSKLKLEFGMLVFVKGGKPEESEKYPQSKGEPTTNSTQVWEAPLPLGIQTNASLSSREETKIPKSPTHLRHKTYDSMPSKADILKVGMF